MGNEFFIALSQKSVSRCLAEVTNAINAHLMQEMIRFPTQPVELQSIKRFFYQELNFPGIIGLIDCTHVEVIEPWNDPPNIVPQQFMNRKSVYSINVQLVSKN